MFSWFFEYSILLHIINLIQYIKDDEDYEVQQKICDHFYGWKTVFKMTVKDGKIAESNYNYVNKDSQLKADDEEYEKMMSEKSGTFPQDFVPALNKAFVEQQDAAVVTGATHSWHGFKIYASQLMNATQKGDTTPIVVDNIVFEKQ
jgi:sex pheromone cAD1